MVNNFSDSEELALSIFNVRSAQEEWCAWTLRTEVSKSTEEPVTTYLKIDMASYPWNISSPTRVECLDPEDGGSNILSNGGHYFQNGMSLCPRRLETAINLV
jgi:hypothetical protein